MVYLNFTDLSEEAQNRLLENSKRDENHTCFDTMIEEEALRNLYSYTYVFNI